MPRPRAALVALAALTACGGGSDEKTEEQKVTDALKQISSHVVANDGKGFCDGVTPETRRLLDRVSAGIDGRRGSCRRIMDRRLGANTDLVPTGLDAVDDAEVEVDGDRASVRDPRGDRRPRLPLRKVEDAWRVDLANFPEEGYGLRTTAACTQSRLRELRRPLPRPTRPGLASEAGRDAREWARLLRTIEKIEPPPGEREAHRRLVRLLRANQRTWDKASKRLRGLGAPLKTFNRALRRDSRRGRQIANLSGDLDFGCFGNALTVRSAAEYRRAAQSACRTTFRRFKRLGKPEPTQASLDQFVRRFEGIGNGLTKRLRRLKPPGLLRPLHRASVRAFDDAIDRFDQLPDATDTDAALERFELFVLRYAVGFFRLGLPRCGEI